jgi:hypothetical protein
MPYCVNCGVELSKPENKCPLCNTPVVNQNKADALKEERAYPRHLDKIMERIDRRYTITLIMLIALIPVLTTGVVDMVINRGITWSAYIIGAFACSFVGILFPFIFKKQKPYFFWFIDWVMLALYIWLINILSGGGEWFVNLALPIVIVAFVVLSAILYIIYYKKLAGFYKAAIIIFLIGVSALGIEFLIYLYKGAVVYTGWSLMACLPCAVIAAILLFIEKNKKLKEQIKKRMFL